MIPSKTVFRAFLRAASDHGFELAIRAFIGTRMIAYGAVIIGPPNTAIAALRETAWAIREQEMLHECAEDDSGEGMS